MADQMADWAGVDPVAPTPPPGYTLVRAHGPAEYPGPSYEVVGGPYHGRRFRDWDRALAAGAVAHTSATVARTGCISVFTTWWTVPDSFVAAEIGSYDTEFAGVHAACAAAGYDTCDDDVAVVWQTCDTRSPNYCSSPPTGRASFDDGYQTVVPKAAFRRATTLADGTPVLWYRQYNSWHAAMLLPARQ